MENNTTSMELKRKRLIFRSWHRGTREIDLMLGRFADLHLPDFNDSQLNSYERLLNNSSPDIYNWISKNEPVPPSEQSEVTDIILDFFKNNIKDCPR